MIWGKTWAERDKEKQDYLLYLDNGGSEGAFAWTPTQLDTGRFIWLQFYKTRPLIYIYYGYYKADYSILYKWVDNE